MSRKSYQKNVQKQEAQQKQRQQRKNTLIAALAAAVVLLIAGVVLFGGSAPKTTTDTGVNGTEPAMTGTYYVQMDVQDYGTITAELYADVAPITVENFLKLVNEGFYDGLTFHRIISGFMIQGGDPNGNGTGGSSQTIKGEFSSNGVQNDLKHVRGVLSMARSSLPDSASSQFFIMHKDASHLDGQYAAFGKVLSGMEVVDAICAQTPVTDGNGTVAKANQPVITSIRQIEKPQ